MPLLTGKTALITGGSRGIGAAIARRYADEGANVAITYVSSPDEAQKVVGYARDRGVEAECYQADAADPAAADSLVEAVAGRFKSLDILVNNAGISPQGHMTKARDDDFDRVVDINVRGVFVATRAAARVLPEGGRVINMGSIFGENAPFPFISLYAMSKFAVAGLTRGWARDLAPKGITVNCIQPGPIDTDLNPADGDFASYIVPRIALGRYGRPDEVAGIAVFLASDDASYMTGATINVDGGFQA